MNDFNSLIDSIRSQEKVLGDIAGRRASAAQAASKAARAVSECQDNIEKLALTEKSLTESGSRYSGLAQKAIRRGLTGPELDQCLTPLCMKAMIQAAGNMTTEAKDEAGKVLLQLQRIASENAQVLKQVETEFAETETMLEDLRDQLRIMQQAQPA